MWRFPALSRGVQNYTLVFKRPTGRANRNLVNPAQALLRGTYMRDTAREREREGGEKKRKKRGTDSKRGAQENSLALLPHTDRTRRADNLYRHRRLQSVGCVDLHGSTDKAETRPGYRQGLSPLLWRGGDVGVVVTPLSSRGPLLDSHTGVCSKGAPQYAPAYLIRQWTT